MNQLSVQDKLYKQIIRGIICIWENEINKKK